MLFIRFFVLLFMLAMAPAFCLAASDGDTVEHFKCGNISSYTCTSGGHGGECAIEIGAPRILVYDDIIKNPKWPDAEIKWCEKWPGITASVYKVHWLAMLWLGNDEQHFAYGDDIADKKDRKDNSSWERKSSQDWPSIWPDSEIDPGDKPQKLNMSLSAEQIDKWLGSLFVDYVGNRKFVRTIIRRTDRCGVPSRAPCDVCYEWGSGTQCKKSVDYCFDGLDIEHTDPEYCREKKLYNNLQYDVDKACGYEWPPLNVWRNEPFSTVIDTSSRQLPGDGLYIFVYRRDNSFVLRKSDRPSQEHKGDQGWCFIGNRDCIWKKADGTPHNPVDPCGPEGKKPEPNPVFVRHSQIASDGGPANQKVIYAGTLEIYGGKVLWLSGRSGHYRPSHLGMQSTIKAFKLLAGLDYDIEYRDFDDPTQCIELPCDKQDVKQCKKYKCKGVPGVCKDLKYEQKTPNACPAKR